MFDKRQDLPCYDQGNAYPFCSPVSTDVWLNGTTHEFVWNYNYPFYVTATSLDLFLYYKENFAYQQIKNWTNLSTNEGQLTVTVDDSWFPSLLTTKANQTWTLYGYYLPSGMNPYTELVNTNSQYPKPYNFSAVQYAYPDQLNTHGSNGSNGNTANTNVSQSNQNIPPWGIAVITLASVAIVVAAMAIAFATYKSRQRKQRSGLSPTTSQHDISAFPLVDEKMSSPSAGQPSIHSTTPMYHAPAMSPTNSNVFRRSGGDGSTDGTVSISNITPTRSPTLLSPSENVFRHMLEQDRLQEHLQAEGTSVKDAEKRPKKVVSVTDFQQQQVAGQALPVPSSPVPSNPSEHRDNP